MTFKANCAHKYAISFNECDTSIVSDLPKNAGRTFKVQFRVIKHPTMRKSALLKAKSKLPKTMYTLSRKSPHSNY